MRTGKVFNAEVAYQFTSSFDFSVKYAETAEVKRRLSVVSPDRQPRYFPKGNSRWLYQRTNRQRDIASDASAGGVLYVHYMYVQKHFQVRRVNSSSQNQTRRCCYLRKAVNEHVRPHITRTASAGLEKCAGKFRRSKNG